MRILKIIALVILGIWLTIAVIYSATELFDGLSVVGFLASLIVAVIIVGLPLVAVYFLVRNLRRTKTSK